MKAITIKENLTQSPIQGIVRAALIATLAVSIFVLAFTWPTKTMEAKDLPISISGSSEMVQKVEDALNEKAPGTFNFVEADSRDDAVQQIKEGETYGGIILSDDGAPEVLTAAAASTATNAMLTNIATQLTAQTQSAAASAQSQGLQDGIAKGNEGIAALQSQVDAAQVTVDQVNQNVTGATNTINDLKPQLEEAQAKVTVAQQQIDSLQETANGDGETANLARTQIESLQGAVDSENATVSDLQSQIDAAQATIDKGGSDEAAGAQATLDQLNPQLTEAKSKVAAAQAQLDSLGTQAEMKEKTTATVTNVVELSEDDSTGAGLTVAAFPLVIGGMLGGILMLTLLQGTWSRLIASTLAAILGGLILTLILHSWFGFLEGSFGLLWLAFMVSNMATSFFIIGVGTLLGKGLGIAIGALTTMLFGNPISGASSPWEFIPSPWGVIGQHMVPGASARLLRSISYFPDASTASQWTTLIAWALFGLVLAGAGFAIARKNQDKRAPEHKVVAEAV